jgi:hypothetical protein
LYGFEGEAGREGEGFTRIRESSHRRLDDLVYDLDDLDVYDVAAPRPRL